MRTNPQFSPLLSVSQLHDVIVKRDRTFVRVVSSGAVVHYELKRLATGIRLTLKNSSGSRRETIQYRDLASSVIGYAIGRSVVTFKR